MTTPQVADIATTTTEPPTGDTEGPDVSTDHHRIEWRLRDQPEGPDEKYGFVICDAGPDALCRTKDCPHGCDEIAIGGRPGAWEHTLYDADRDEDIEHALEGGSPTCFVADAINGQGAEDSYNDGKLRGDCDPGEAGPIEVEWDSGDECWTWCYPVAAGTSAVSP